MTRRTPELSETTAIYARRSFDSFVRPLQLELFARRVEGAKIVVSSFEATSGANGGQMRATTDITAAADFARERYGKALCVNGGASGVEARAIQALCQLSYSPVYGEFRE